MGISSTKRGIRTHAATDAYRDNWDRIFGKKREFPLNAYGRCAKCNGFGYTKGGPLAPWDKLDCEACQ